VTQTSIVRAIPANIAMVRVLDFVNRPVKNKQIKKMTMARPERKH
jgi:hypothetical protein